MDRIPVSMDQKGFLIQGYPNAAKAIRIEGPDARRLADLSLHISDLEFAKQCLEEINDVPVEHRVVREALWQSAIIHLVKCFGGNNSRSALHKDTVYEREPSDALVAFDYFRNMRNKHVVHDDNAFLQSLPGAILNKEDQAHKIEKIICFSAKGVTLEQANYSNLKLLVEKALEVVVAEFDGLCAKLTTELEREDYNVLLAREGPTYRVPTIDDVGQKRKAT